MEYTVEDLGPCKVQKRKTCFGTTAVDSSVFPECGWRLYNGWALSNTPFLLGNPSSANVGGNTAVNCISPPENAARVEYQGQRWGIDQTLTPWKLQMAFKLPLLTVKVQW